MTHAHSSQPFVVSPPSPAQALPAAEVFGTLFFEVVLSGPVSAATSALPAPLPLLTVPGWTLRLWPQARLGDATLEASRNTAGQTVSGLRAALGAQGVSVLGPVR